MKHLNKLTLLLIAITMNISLTAQNNCLDFDGTDNVSLGTSTSLRPTSTITVEAWVNPDTKDKWEGIICNLQDNSSNESGYGLFISANNPDNVMWWVQTIGGTTGNYTNYPEYSLPNNEWTHVAGTYDGSNLCLYINGISRDTKSKTGNIDWTTIPPLDCRIGEYYDEDENKYFDGKIEEVRIWDDVRTEAEIRANMYREIPNPASEANLVAYYQFNETSGTNLPDESVNSNNGTLTNMSGNEWQTSPAFAGPKNCLDFDGGLLSGSPDYAYKNSYVTSNTDNFTMMAWVKPDVVTNGVNWRCIAYNGDDAGGYGFGINDSKVAGLFGVTQWNTTDEVLTTGNWYHIVMRRNSGTVQFFLNGELLSYSNATAPNTPNTKFSIGNMYASDGSTIYTDSFDGQIDEVRVYDAALTDQQIRESMCNSLVGDEANLVAYYNFDNKSGTTLQSFDGSTSNDLTLVNTSDDDWISSTAFNTWLNTNSTTWATATNWSDGAVPTLTDNVGIPDYGGSHPTLSGTTACNNLVVGNGVTLTHYTGSHTIHGSAFVIGHSDINNGYFLTVTKNLYILPLSTLDVDPGGQLTIGNNLYILTTGTCTVKSDASGTGSLIVEGSSTDDIIFKRYVNEASKAATWHYVSSPVAGQDLNVPWMSANSILFNDPAYQLYRWDEDTDYWIYYRYTGSEPEDFGDATFIEARGYAATRTEAGELSFTGTVRTSDVDYLTTHTAGEGDGFNLVGNPFTSAIGITSSASSSENFLNENSTRLDDSYEALYIWDEQTGYQYGDNDYKVICNAGYSGFGSNSILSQDYISPGQAFMVKVASAGNLAFNENMQAHNNATFYKNDDLWPSVELIVENDELFNSTAIGFNENMTKGLDPSYDVGKLKGNPDIALYTKLIEDNGVDFTIQALPSDNIENFVVPVGIDVLQNENLEFSANIEQLDENEVFLEDRQLNIITDLKKSTYTATIGESGTGRFFLHFKDITAIEEVNYDDQSLRVYSTGKTLYLINQDQIEGYMRISNLMGQEITKLSFSKDTKQQFTLNVTPGYYLVIIYNAGKVFCRKVFIK